MIEYEHVLLIFGKNEIIAKKQLRKNRFIRKNTKIFNKKKTFKIF